MTPTHHIIPMVENIHNRANNVLLSGEGDEGLLFSLDDIMDEIKKVIEASTYQELDGYCDKYNGFYRYARLLEQLSEDILMKPSLRQNRQPQH